MSPFGVRHPEALPLVAAEAALAAAGQVWMGGGHCDLKLGIGCRHLVTALRPIIADISDPR